MLAADLCASVQDDCTGTVARLQCHVSYVPSVQVTSDLIWGGHPAGNLENLKVVGEDRKLWKTCYCLWYVSLSSMVDT